MWMSQLSFIYLYSVHFTVDQSQFGAGFYANRLLRYGLDSNATTVLINCVNSNAWSDINDSCTVRCSWVTVKRSLLSCAQHHVCDRLQCSNVIDLNVMQHFSRLVNLESCNSKNMLKVFKRAIFICKDISQSQQWAFTLKSHSRHVA